jgi:N-methylhydantoinase B
LPVRVQQYSVVPDTGGPGVHRGGMAFRFDFEVFHPDALVTSRGMERFRFQPRGFRGGAPGATGDCWLDPDTSTARRLGKINSITLQPGEVLSLRTPGGGGYGDPFEREPAAVLSDVRNGLVSLAAARRDYGVVIVDGQLDLHATEHLRHAGARPRYGMFEPGEARAAHEAVFTPEIADALAEVLYELPASARYSAKQRMYRVIRERVAAGSALSADAVRELSAELSGREAGRENR